MTVMSPSSGNHRSGGRFRPDLEGLRAVAVILVLLYHAGVAGFGGGYIGVDVFFVLSGFLITGLIYRELSSTGRFSFSNFYARRARRLLPAAGFVLIVSLVVALVVLPSFRLPAVQTDIASAGLYVSNMRFGFEANDYFQATADPSPVLHFWSLSVEEQFYILWPTILVGLFAWLPGVVSRDRRVVIGTAVIGLVSLVAAIWLTGVNQPWAFYLLPTRAWELGAGGLIAIGLGRLSAIPPRWAATATVVGVACVVVAALVFDDSTPFPGLAAILPVAGASLVILGGLPREAPLPSRVLALPPFRFLGRISYSLYLWHWPILLFGGLLLGPAAAIPLALLAIPVAAASQRWIEEPLRYGRFIGTRPSRNLLQAAGVGLAVVIAAAGVSAIPGGPGAIAAGDTSPVNNIGPQPCSGCSLADLTPPLTDLMTGRIPDADCDVADPADCVLGSTSPNAPVIALFGDSHAGNWTSVLSQLATAHGWRFVHLTHGGCPSLMTPIWSLTLKRAFTECDEWRDEALARLEAERPDLIIVTNSDHPSLVDANGGRVSFSNPPTEAWAKLWSTGLDKMLARLTGIGGSVAVIGDGPVPSSSALDPPACIATHPTDFQQCRAARGKAAPPAVHDLGRSITAARDAIYVDPTPWFCGPDICPAVIDHFVVYSDGSGHLTTPFVLSLADRLVAALPFPSSRRSSSGAAGAVSPSPIDSGPQPCSGCTLDELTPRLDDLGLGRLPDGDCDPADPGDCAIGSSSASAPVVAIFGDSHAGNWTAVLADMATAHGWRFVHLTSGVCPSVLAPIWSQSLKRAYEECDQWREAAIARLEQEHPDLIIVANNQSHVLVDASGGQVPNRNPPSSAWLDLWSAGLDKVLGRLTGIGGRVAILGDGPLPAFSSLDPAACLAENPTDVQTCAAGRSRAVPSKVREIEQKVGASHHVAFVDPVPWLCGPVKCPAVIGHYVVYMDKSGRLTAPFTRTLADRLLAAMPFPG